MSDKLSERYCLNCDVAGRSQVGGEWIVVCKNATTGATDGRVDCGAILADETEASPYVTALEADNEALKQRVENLEETNMLFSERGASLVVEKKALEQRVEGLEKALRELSNPMTYEHIGKFHGRKLPWNIAKEALADDDLSKLTTQQKPTEEAMKDG